MIRSAKILCLLLLISSCLSASDEEKENNTKSSLLKSGKWFKAAIIKDGVYRIDFSKLRQIGLEDPSNPRIFSNNNGQLSYYNNSPSPDDLHEIAISVIRGEDQIFNEGDYILFYGKGTGRWNYDKESGYYYHKRHNYSDTAFYFITSGAEGGKKIEDYTQPASDPDYMSQVSDALYIHELETENIIKSGREWYQPVSAVKGTLIDPGFSDLVISEPVKYSFRVLARSPVPALFRLLDGSEIIKSILIPGVNISSISGTYAQHAETSGTITPATVSPVF